MAYRSTGVIQIKEETKRRLSKYKGERESWNAFFIRLLEEWGDYEGEEVPQEGEGYEEEGVYTIDDPQEDPYTGA